jgi:arylsulfatase A-like enzyme
MIRRRILAELRLACSVGLVGGALLGTRESLVTVDANAFVQPVQYLSGYLLLPILSWMLLAVLLLAPVGLALGLLSKRAGGERFLPVYSALLALAGALSIGVPAADGVAQQMRAVGAPPGAAARLAIWLVVAAMAAGAAAIAWAAAAWFSPRAARPLRWATRGALVLCLLLSWPLVRFLATDWKWGPLPFAARSAAPPSGAPNVVLISIDTLRADRLGEPTPRLDRLGAEGVVFRSAITSAPWTLPAMASIMTGLYPHHHGAGEITNRRDPLGRSALPSASWNLATALADRGWRTHAIVTNPYLALRYGLGAGFATYENVTIESEFFVGSSHTTAMRIATWLRPDLEIGDRGETVSRRAVDWLAAHGAEGPFFLWVHYIDPHPPYTRAGTGIRKSFRTDALLAPTATPEPLTLTSPDVARLRSGEIRLDAQQKDDVRALYRAEVASVDAAVGSVLDAIDRAGVRERTLVVCVADHGEEFWEHGGVEHGHTAYEELVRVPLLMRWPGRLPAGAAVDAVVRITDVPATVIDLLGLPVPAGTDGTTALPLLRGEEPDDRVALVENMLFAEERTGVRTRDRKYVRWENGKEELYDLAADPGERRDLAAVPSMQPAVDALRAAAEHGAAAPTAAGALPGDERGRAALRALGYVR